MAGTAPVQESDSIPWLDLKYFFGEASEILVKHRITEGLTRYSESYHKARAHNHTTLFDDCPVKLSGSGNYPEWHNWLKNHADMAGFHCLQLGKAEAPMQPEEPASTKDWNIYILEKAWWEGMNHSMTFYMQRTVDSSFRSKISDCKLVSEAMDIIDKACPPLSLGEGAYRLNALLTYRFDGVVTFSEFSSEFEKRYWHYNHMRGGVEMDEQHHCLLFWRALGPPFADLKEFLNMSFSLTRTRIGGVERDMTWSDLQHLASCHWDRKLHNAKHDERKRVAAKRLDITNKRERQQRKRQRRR